MPKPSFRFTDEDSFAFSLGRLSGTGDITTIVTPGGPVVTGATFTFEAGRLSGSGELDLATGTLTIDREIETASDNASLNAPDHQHLPELSIPVPPPLLDLLM